MKSFQGIITFGVLFESLLKEMAANHTLFREELGRISSRVAVMEGQRPPFAQTGSGPEQSLHTALSNIHTEKQSLASAATQAEQQSLLDYRDRADGAEPQTEDTLTHERPDAMKWDWGEDGDDVITPSTKVPRLDPNRK